MTPPSLTLRDAALATGLSVKALRRRVERGTLPAEVVDGFRRIPVDALLAAGLLVTTAGGRPAPARRAPDIPLARRLAALEERVAELERRLNAIGPAGG